MAKKKTQLPDYQLVTADWKDTEGLIEDFAEAIKHFGLHIIADPVCEESDQYGFIVSKNELSQTDLRDIVEEYCPGYYDSQEEGKAAEKWENEFTKLIHPLKVDVAVMWDYRNKKKFTPQEAAQQVGIDLGQRLGKRPSKKK